MANIMLINQTIFMLKVALALYSINKTHILTNLIIIELMVVATMAVTFATLVWIKMELFMALLMLILMITESILGLSILINLIRTHSNDYMKSTTSTSM